MRPPRRSPDRTASRPARRIPPNDLPDVDEAPEEPDGDPPQIAPPHSWDAAAKARFRELPADVQELIAEREDAAEQVIQAAADARDRAEGEASEAEQMTQALDHLLPQAAQTFAGKWDGVDWAAWAQADPQAAFQGRMAFEAEQAQLHQLAEAQAQARAVSHRQFVAGEAARLKAVAPELADPKAGPARRQAVARFLTDLGATQDQLSDLTAEEAALAYDALQWRQARAGLTGYARGEAGQTNAEADHRTVRPSAGQAPRTSQARRQSDAMARLSRFRQCRGRGCVSEGAGAEGRQSVSAAPNHYPNRLRPAIGHGRDDRRNSP